MYKPMTAVAAAFACALVSTTVARVQDDSPTKRPPQGATQQGTTMESPTRDAAKETNAVLATWLLVDHKNEIALAELAQQKAESSEVREFAQTMIDEHQKLVDDLKKFAPQAGMRVGTSGSTGAGTSTGREGDMGGTTGGKTGGTSQEEQGRDRTGMGGSSKGVQGTLDHAQLIQDLGRKCLESAQQALNEKSGREFDECYMGMQVMMHQGVKDQMEVFQNYASSDLASAIQEQQQHVERHLQKAKDLSKQISAGQVSRRDER